jgi:hypothetical protein
MTPHIGILGNPVYLTDFRDKFRYMTEYNNKDLNIYSASLRLLGVSVNFFRAKIIVGQTIFFFFSLILSVQIYEQYKSVHYTLLYICTRGNTHIIV